jgi:hypothetical protein
MRALLRFSLAVMALAALAPAAVSQQAFPTHPIRLIVPYPAGGATDVVARIVGGTYRMSFTNFTNISAEGEAKKMVPNLSYSSAAMGNQQLRPNGA